MTEWNAVEYAQRSALQTAMAEEVLALLRLEGSERVLDVGCGDGRITAEIARRVPLGSVVGIDPSHRMIELANSQFDPTAQRNLRFEVRDARRMNFTAQFDLVVSFNALHWIPEQKQTLQSVHTALRPGGTAQLRLVPKGPRKSLEDVIEETRQLPRWKEYFTHFTDPYLHLTPEQYTVLAEGAGFHVKRVHSESKGWNFETRSAFEGFGAVTFAEWTKALPVNEQPAFITYVLDRYAAALAETPAEANTFKFYQMDVTLER